MIKTIKRENLPMRFKVYDSNWNRGIIIGNTIIFTSYSRKETKKIKRICQYNGYTHAYYVEYKDEPILYTIYIRNKIV